MKGFLTGLVAVALLTTATCFVIDGAAITALERSAGQAMLVVGEMDGEW